MKSNKENCVLDLVGKFAVREVEKKTGRNGYWWPPACAGFLHQPKRPARREK